MRLITLNRILIIMKTITEEQYKGFVEEYKDIITDLRMNQKPQTNH